MSFDHAHSGVRVASAAASDAGTAGGSSIAPVVDVGILTLGQSPSFLIEAVESVFTQTFSSWRLVISENGPGLDSVREALEPYVDDPRVEHVVTGAKEGRGKNWTRASQGSAPYIGLLDDDDRWAPEFLERRTEFLDRHQRVGLVAPGQSVRWDSLVEQARGAPLAVARIPPPQRYGTCASNGRSSSPRNPDVYGGRIYKGMQLSCISWRARRGFKEDPPSHVP
jgi:glycosyltransferase involved in cell wall biosynthesis